MVVRRSSIILMYLYIILQIACQTEKEITKIIFEEPLIFYGDLEDADIIDDN